MLEVGDVVEFDRILFAKRTRGEGALVEIEARRKPRLIGQVSAIEGQVVVVIWENGREIPYGSVPWLSERDLLIEP